MSLIEPTPLWRYKDVAAYLNVSEQTVAIWRKHRGLPSVVLGRTVRFCPRAVAVWVEQTSDQAVPA